MNGQKPLVLGEVLRRAIEFFKNYAVAEPRLDAEVLLAHVLKKERIQLYVNYDLPLSEEEKAAYRSLVAARVRGEPVSYLVGEKEFMSLKFAVDRRVLIPRPETEFLVEAALDELKERSLRETPEVGGGGNSEFQGDPDRLLTVFELGTGSGAVAVSTAYFSRKKDFHLKKIYGVDITTEILEVAQKNAARYELEDVVTFLTGDLFTAFSGLDLPRADLIISNPPYIPTGQIENLQPEISKFEPREALDGGRDGLYYYRRIISESPEWIIDGGNLLLELGLCQSDRVQDLLAARGFKTVEIYEDYSEIPRVIKAVWPGEENNGLK